MNFYIFHFRRGAYKFKQGATAVLRSQVIPIEVEEEIVRPIDCSSMDTS